MKEWSVTEESNLATPCHQHESVDQLRSSRSLPIGVSTRPGIRTRNLLILNQTPLPVGPGGLGGERTNRTPHPSRGAPGFEAGAPSMGASLSRSGACAPGGPDGVRTRGLLIDGEASTPGCSAGPCPRLLPAGGLERTTRFELAPPGWKPGAHPDGPRPRVPAGAQLMPQRRRAIGLGHSSQGHAPAKPCSTRSIRSKLASDRPPNACRCAPEGAWPAR